MNDNQPDNTPESSEEQVSTLRHQLTSALFLVLALSVIMTWFFGYQCYFAYTESRDLKPAAVEARKRLEDFKANREPNFLGMVRKLQDFSKTHPDVLPILNKYGVMQITNAPAAGAKK
jgi:hypothetical protein